MKLVLGALFLCLLAPAAWAQTPCTAISPAAPSCYMGVGILPTSASAAAIAPVPSAAAESNHVLKASAGNFYSAYVTTGATAGYFMVFNATSLPANGAVTPVHCIQVAANSSASISTRGGPPESFGTGITAGFSTTGCFTLTASATAFFEGDVQ